MRGWLSNLLIFVVDFRIVSTLYKWQIRRFAHVQRVLLVSASQDISSLAAELDEVKNDSQRIAKVEQSITNAAVASTQSLAILLGRFAKTVSGNVAIAQDALLAALMKNALESAIMHRILGRGALHAKRLGLVPNADAVRVIRRSHLQGQFATIVTVPWMFFSNRIPSIMRLLHRRTKR